MKQYLFIAAFLPTFWAAKAQNAPNCNAGVTLNKTYAKAAGLDSILRHYASAGLPGVSLAIYSETEGWWSGTAGYARIETRTPMEKCHLQYLQSVSKTYMAVAILQLTEKKRIALDTPITRYLPQRTLRFIKNPAAITVRMLLNHRSGIPEYNSEPSFVSQVIEHPLSFFNAGDCLKSIDGKDPLFTPGTKYSYANTNYLLLSLIADELTGDHAAYIQQHIFKPLGLKDTYYGKGYNYLKGQFLPDSYWDVFNSGRPANITGMQQATVVSSKGDDGIVCTPIDAVLFLKGLMEGKLLDSTSMKEMLAFVTDEKGHKRYGMGVAYFDLGGLPAYGHGGGGIGAGCGLLYIPSHKLYVFFATNLGVLVESDLVKKADEMKNAILLHLLQ